MKQSILLALATTAIPFLVMAQAPETPPAVPAVGEEKPRTPAEPVPAPATPPVPVPDLPPPVVPPAVPSLVPPVVVPVMPPVLTPVPAVPDSPEKPARPSKPGFKRPGPPGLEEKPGAPETPVPVPAPSAPEADPKPKGEPPAPAPGMKPPSTNPAETAPSATPPAAPGTPGKRPFPGKRGPKGRTFDPAQTPTPFPGTPMPAVTPAPEVPAETKPAERPERPVAEKPPSKETAKVLQDEGKRDRQADAAQARKIDNKDDAKRLLMNILGAAVGVQVPNQPQPANQPRPTDRFRQGYRPPVEEVGRTQRDRERNVGSMVHRFQGLDPQSAPPGIRDPRNPAFNQGPRAPRFYEGNRRVVRYSSMQEIPPVIVASQQLNRVQVLRQEQSTYSVRPPAPQAGLYYNDIPPSYTTDNAYAVSYTVDPKSAISRDDILFRQGSADFADAYSYDLVIDVAEAMKAPELLKETFVIEGHASAEGDYAKNLLLSQERAERISRELVRHGVSAERLMPVGYGEAEAAHPATAAERERRLDRRVMVFRMR